jgi:hypothetical protein
MRFPYLFSFLAFAVAGLAQTTTTATRSLAFPPVGLAFSETAQINVANTAAISATATATAASCTGTISFNTAAGAAAETPVKFTVAAGQIFSAELTAAKLGVINGQRAEFIGSVQVALTPKTPCTLSISLETFDSTTGVTHLYLPNPASGQVLGVFPGGAFGRFSEVPQL